MSTETTPIISEAIITTVDHKLTDASTCTIDGQTVPVPPGTMVFARVLTAVHGMGYRSAYGYVDEHMEWRDSGHLIVRVKPKLVRVCSRIVRPAPSGDTQQANREELHR